MKLGSKGIARIALVAAALALLVVGPLALAQRSRSLGAGSVIFVTRRPPREFTGNIRSWAQGNHATGYQEDTASHVWRVQMIVALPRVPNTPDLTLAWFHVQANRERTYVSNETVGLSNPPQRNFYHQTVLVKGVNTFEPMEHYEAVFSMDDGRGGQTNLAHGAIQLIGQVERRNGNLDFTRDGGT